MSDGGLLPSPGSPERAVLSLLHRVHARLVDRAGLFVAGEVERASYCREWSVAQVYSHLGSGAEIGALALAAARDGLPQPDPRRVWDRWDAKAPTDMVADFAPADSAYLQALQAAVNAVEEGDVVVVPIDGRPWPLVQALTARLVEVALHEWDVAVVDDPDADVDADAASWTLRAFPLEVAAHAAAPVVASRLAPRAIEIEITKPTDRLLLDIQQAGVQLIRDRSSFGSDAVLTLPDAAAWMRLVSGRWRPVDDTRSLISGHLSFTELTDLFPGF